MQSFISLREFLLLRDTISKNRSAHTTIRTPEQWISFYDIAKASYEKYGESGPPIGSRVVTLVAGHGGQAGIFRIFDGVLPSDPRFFSLSRIEEHHMVLWPRRAGDVEERKSLVQRNLWWNEIRAYESAYIIVKNRNLYWQGSDWTNVWLTAKRYETKSVAGKDWERLNRQETCYILHAESGW